MAISITSALPTYLRANDVVIITGSGFGATKGKVTFGGVKAVCNPWSDTSIQCCVPMGVPGGAGNMVITHADGVTTGTVPLTHQRSERNDSSAVKVPDRDHD